MNETRKVETGEILVGCLSERCQGGVSCFLQLTRPAAAAAWVPGRWRRKVGWVVKE